MFYKIEKELRGQPRVTPREAPSQKGLFWVNGILSVGLYSQNSDGKAEKELHHFMIANDANKPNLWLSLAAKDEYFTSGYDRMASEKEIFGIGIWEPVEALIRPAFSNPHSKPSWHMYTPILLLRKATSDEHFGK